MPVCSKLKSVCCWASPSSSQAIPFNPDSPMGTAAPAQGAFAPTYSVAKAQLNQAVQLLAQDGAFKARGVRIVSTCPGWCRWAAAHLRITELCAGLCVGSTAAGTGRQQVLTRLKLPTSWVLPLSGGHERILT